ncbi:MAG: exodeoxyribonuclease VII small subunit [Pseudomonadales bacterium]
MPRKSTTSTDPQPAATPAEFADLDFEAALAELETLVTSMESGELGLEASLKAFERGVALTRHCQSALKNAELKVKVLTEANTLEDLDVDTLDDA